MQWQCNARAAGRAGSGRAAYLAGGVDDLGGIFLGLVANDLAEGVLDGGVVALDKVAVDKLHRQAGFAWGAAVSRAAWACAGACTYRRLCCRQWQSCAAWGRPWCVLAGGGGCRGLEGAARRARVVLLSRTTSVSERQACLPKVLRWPLR